jgi:hypothetical protein
MKSFKFVGVGSSGYLKKFIFEGGSDSTWHVDKKSSFGSNHGQLFTINSDLDGVWEVNGFVSDAAHMFITKDDK